MKHRLWLTAILLFCLLVFLAAFGRAFSYGGQEAYGLALVSFVVLVAVYCVGVLDFKVGGSSLALERRVDEVVRRNEELSRAVQHLTRALLVVKDAGSTMDGALPQHEALLREYLAGLREHMPDDLISSTEARIAAHVRGAQR